MRPEELILDVLQRWWIVLLAALVAGLAGYLVAVRQADEYSVSVRLVANAEPADYWLDQYAKARLAVYGTLIDNHGFVERAMSTGNVPIDAGEARSKLRLSHVESTNTLTIRVVDSDSQRAADIANAVAAAFVEWNDEQNASLVARARSDEEPFPARVVLAPLEFAGPPATASGPSARSTAFAAALLGVVAGFVVVFLMMYRDDTIKTRHDIQRYLGQPLLATVPAKPMKTGGAGDG